MTTPNGNRGKGFRQCLGSAGNAGGFDGWHLGESGKANGLLPDHDEHHLERAVSVQGVGLIGWELKQLAAMDLVGSCGDAHFGFPLQSVEKGAIWGGVLAEFLPPYQRRTGLPSRWLS